MTIISAVDWYEEGEKTSTSYLFADRPTSTIGALVKIATLYQDIDLTNTKDTKVYRYYDVSKVSLERPLNDSELEELAKAISIRIQRLG